MEIRVPIAYYGVVDKQKDCFTKTCFEKIVKDYKDRIKNNNKVFVRENFSYTSMPMGILMNLELEDNALMATIQIKDDKAMVKMLEGFKYRPGFFIKKSHKNPDDIRLYNDVELTDIGFIPDSEDIY